MREEDLGKHLIILTCTVRPNSKTKVKRNDPELRLDDYIASIIKWVQLSKYYKFKIVVIENSQSVDLLMKRIPKEFIDQISFFQFSEDLEVSTRGISHGEFKLLQQFASQIQLYQNYEYIWKVTGRLFLSNFSKLVPKESFDLVVNRFYYPRHLIDTRVIGFSLPTFKLLLQLTPNFYESIIDEQFDIFSDPLSITSLEDLLTYFTHRCEMTGKQVKSMKKIPIYEGTSASINKQLDKGILRIGIRISNLVRPIAIKMLRGSAP